MRFALGAISAVVLGASLSITSLSGAEDAADSASASGSTTRPTSTPSAPSGGRGSAETSTGATSAAAERPPSATPSEGYTWRSEKRKPQKPHRARLDPKRPLVQAPTFQIMADGTSVVSLTISRAVSVVERRVGRRLEYRLDTAQVGVDNNLNPLVTGHFPTPLLRAALRRERRAVVLVLLLREHAAPHHVVRAGPAGVVLEITLPKPTRPSPTAKSAETGSREQAPLERARRTSIGSGPRP